MEHDERIKRINELAAKAKKCGLDEAELLEQRKLREEYLALFRQSFKQKLDSIKIVRQ